MPDSRSEELLTRLLAAHSSHYDITRDYRFGGRVFSGFAEFHSHGEQYVLVKRAKLWEVDTHEYLFINIEEELDEEDMQRAIDFMIEEAFRKVAPGPTHMSSAISLILIASSVTDGAVRLLQKTRLRKSYRLSFHGWADLRLAVADLSRPLGKQVFTNAAGKQLRGALENNLALSSND